MTEEEWLTKELGAILDYVVDTASQRQLRLLASAWCRRVSKHLWTSASVPAVEVAERCADQQNLATDLVAARDSVVELLELYPGEPVYDASYWACVHDMKREDVVRCAGYAANCSATTLEGIEADNAVQNEFRQQTRIFRDIFGNPFRPVTFDPEWLTPTVVQLASHIYESRAFDQMPILADALQDAGCDNADVLSHCRDPQQVHVRGCWVVDGVLGKS